MSSLGPITGNPFHIARAYQMAAPRPAATVTTTAQPEAVRSGIDRLVAGVVPGRINFAGEAPAQNGGAIAMYRHPADRNTAATAVHAGRMVDMNA
jgi:hypothetical protein